MEANHTAVVGNMEWKDIKEIRDNNTKDHDNVGIGYFILGTQVREIIYFTKLSKNPWAGNWCKYLI